MTGHNDHFLSVVYLKWFTSGKKPAKKLWCFDKSDGSIEWKHIKKIGSEKGFNTIEVSGADPRELEKVRDRQIEMPLGPILYEVRKSQALPPPDSEQFHRLLSLVALFYIQNPSKRREYLHVLDRVNNKAAQLRSQIKSGGLPILNGKLHPMFARAERTQYRPDFDTSTTAQIIREWHCLDDVTNELMKRRWSIVNVQDESVHFVTSDRPVVIFPTSLDNQRVSPGIGLDETCLLFSLNNRQCMVGFLGGVDKRFVGISDDVAAINTIHLGCCQKYIYSTLCDFEIISSNGARVSASEKFKTCRAQRQNISDKKM